MIYSLSGRLVSKAEHFAVVETVGVGLKVFMGTRSLETLPAPGAQVKVFCSLYLREDAVELYGFRTEDELRFFELLTSVGGVGPKSGLAILNVAEIKNIAAAIKEGRPDLLTRASGVGRKTAERVIVELRGKVEAPQAGAAVEKMESDADIVEALAGLGYRREEVKAALEKVVGDATNVEARLKAALKILGRGGEK